MSALIASLLYALGDYIGYSLTKDIETQEAPRRYRYLQAIVLACIAMLLWVGISFFEALAFGVFWWTFGCDWLYYGIAWLLNPSMQRYGRWDGREAVMRDFEDGIMHAFWTPVGIFGYLAEPVAIPVKVLIAQSIVGFAILVFI